MSRNNPSRESIGNRPNAGRLGGIDAGGLRVLMGYEAESSDGVRASVSNQEYDLPITSYQEVLADKAATDSFGLGYTFDLPEWFRVVDPPVGAMTSDKNQDTVIGSTERYLDAAGISRAMKSGEVQATSISTNRKVEMRGFSELPFGYSQDYKLDFRVKTAGGFKQGSLELTRLKFLSEDEDPDNLRYKKVYWVMQPTKKSETFGLEPLQKESPAAVPQRRAGLGLALPGARSGDAVSVSKPAESFTSDRVQQPPYQAHRAPVDEAKDMIVHAFFNGVPESSGFGRVRHQEPAADLPQLEVDLSRRSRPAAAVVAESEVETTSERMDPVVAEPEARPKQALPSAPVFGQTDMPEQVDDSEPEPDQSGRNLEFKKAFIGEPVSKQTLKDRYNQHPRRYKAAAIAAAVLVVWGSVSHFGGGSGEGGQAGADLSQAELAQLISKQATKEEKAAAAGFEDALVKGDFSTTGYYQASGKLAQEVLYKGNWFPQGTYANPGSFPDLVHNFYIGIDGKFKLDTQDNPNAFGVYPSAKDPSELVVVADLSKFVTEPTDTGENAQTHQTTSFSTTHGGAMSEEQGQALVEKIKDHPLYGIFSVEDTGAAVNVLKDEKNVATGVLLGEYAVLSQISSNYGSDITAQTEKALETYIAKTAKAKGQTIANVEFINTKKRPSALSNFTNGQDISAYSDDPTVARLKGANSNTQLVGVDELKISKAQGN